MNSVIVLKKTEIRLKLQSGVHIPVFDTPVFFK